MNTEPPAPNPPNTPNTPTDGVGPAVSVDCFAVGPFETNCYIVRVAGETECWIVDAGFDPEPIIAAVREMGLTATWLLLTHAHVDHIAGVEEVRSAFPGLKVAIHEAEERFLADPALNLSLPFGMSITTSPADRLLQDGDTLTLAGTTWSVLHTPGHSPGGVTFHHGPSSTALVGDTLFLGSIGRSDFPTSDERLLHASIREVLYALPGDTIVYPGHGPTTTIQTERTSNMFVRA
ncbi:MAG: MBL fold metallo-hydrolase [Phycisphaerales bacterium]|nr:MBL fold metallo-hydrolase [Phycisphaerales bacterium]